MAIYFLQEQGGDWMIKIGYSSNIGKRIKTLQTASPRPLLLVGTIPQGTQRQESDWHRKFRYCNANNEWFYPSETLVKHIEHSCMDAMPNIRYYRDAPKGPSLGFDLEDREDYMRLSALIASSIFAWAVAMFWVLWEPFGVRPQLPLVFLVVSFVILASYVVIKREDFRAILAPDFKWVAHKVKGYLNGG